MKGAQNITYSQFNAVSATNNQINFNVQMPSQETILSRDIYLQAQITLTIDVPVVPAGAPVNPMSRAIKLMVGKNDAFAPFPLHQLIQTQTCTLNNNSITQHTKDILPALLRMLPPSELQKYESTTPVLADWVADYNSCVEFNDKVVAAKVVPGSTDSITPFLYSKYRKSIYRRYILPRKSTWISNG